MLLNSKWLTYATGEPKDRDSKYGNPAAYFRREFSLSGSVKKAVLLISALGVFKAYVNGKETAGDYLSPGWVDYSKKLPLVEYDITHLLERNNAIGIILGDGWATGHIGSNYTFKRNNYADRNEFTATVRIEYNDGRQEDICTDERWKASSGEILYNDIYMGEYVDRRRSPGDFSRFGYDDSGWDEVEIPVFKFSRNLYLQRVSISPIVVKHIFCPNEIGRNGKRILYDVGQNIAGVLRCVFRGERGAKVICRHGEMLKDGALYTENLRKAEATDTYVLSGEGNEGFRPLFTYHGFRFAELELIGNVEVLSVTAEAMYTDLAETGGFSCSDPIVNQIFSNALWGQRDNFMSVPTDCPQRDERLGWTGDAQIFCRSAMFNMDCRAYYEKYLADIRDAQLGNGMIPAVAPLPRVGSYSYTGRDCAAGWSEAIGEIAYQHYLMYGDLRVLRKNLHALKHLLEYYESDRIGMLRDGGNMYGDWLSVGEVSDLSVIANLYYAHAADLAARMCKILGDGEEAYYRDLFLQIRSAFRKAYLSEDGTVLSDTQSVYAIGYQFGLLDASEAALGLRRGVERANAHLTTGFLGVKYLLPTLCELGMKDLAYQIITEREYPGWGYSILNGATTIWEHWDSYTKEKGFLPGMNSFNHYSLGSCVEWMYTHCLGISVKEENAGFSRIVLAPYLDDSGRIDSAKGHYNSVAGRIAVEWRREGETFVYEASLPDVPAEFFFDGMDVLEETSENGSYRFILTQKT